MATGHTPSRRHPEYWGGDIPWINVGDARIVDGSVIHTTNECTNPLGIENSAAVVLPAGTVCLSRTGSIGYAIVLGREMATSQGFVNWVCGGSLLPRFLQLLFLAERSFLHEISEGVAHTTIYFPEAKAFHICIPPIEIQSQIAERVDSELTRVAQGVEALTRVRANLKRYRAAVLKAACEGTLVPTEADLARAEGRDYETGDQLLERILTTRRENWTGKGKYKDPTPPDTTGLPPLPKGWTWATVDMVARRLQYGSSAKTQVNADGIPVLRMGNIVSGQLSFDELKYLPKSHDEFPALLLDAGDVLFNRTNSFELVGKSAVFRGHPSPCSFASYLIRVQLVPGYIPDLLSLFLNSVFGRQWLSRVASQQVGQANVNGSKLQALAIPLPPLAEQHRIVAEVERRLSIIDGLETLVETNLARAGRLRQSILAKAFSGELVPVSGDGTASPPPAPRTTKGPPSRGPEGRPTAGKGPVQSSVSR